MALGTLMTWVGPKDHMDGPTRDKAERLAIVVTSYRVPPTMREKSHRDISAAP